MTRSTATALTISRILAGYEADVDMEDDTYYAVVKAPALEVDS